VGISLQSSSPLPDQILRCCAGKPVKKITYSCGPNGQETFLVCWNHYQLEAFNNKATIIVEEDVV